MYETNYPTQPKEGWVGHPALAIFTELKMPRERDAVQAELKKVASG